MQFVESDTRYIIRLEKGESIIDKLTEFASSENVTTAFFYGLGAVLEAELGFYNLKTKTYTTKSFETDHEILNLTGNVSLVDDKPFIHAHITLANDEFIAVGGHVMRAVVGATCEISLFSEDARLERTLDENIGLKLLDCSTR